ncbi:uncharacterized protein BCR38DRAFT_428010 [Pseudomassariella vexata]|uniref:Uncharacterized protein n=1 Tax=Pseudomassariella vexata TaxID=1141098 RepID=A0A1Y2E834_9PEZI|nr:uncharacterized protein BCR38DRAFT_428010 [Pseudomassariella vexata]ORY67733.1 hypothetical protein BCR38DRAFT_428010 [Pseudomassariella vexata]
MLSRRLEAISKDANNPDGIAELVVTALGSGGCFYICWKTHEGLYEQDSYGIPSKLHKWLFSPDGRGRDFATLQVILGPGEDEFLASDRYDKIENKTAEPPPRLQRSATSRSLDASAERRRIMTLMNTNADAPGANAKLRRRSTTLSTLVSDSSRRQSLLLNNSNPIVEESRYEGRPRRIYFVPSAIRPNRPPRSRHSSMDSPQPQLGNVPESTRASTTSVPLVISTPPQKPSATTTPITPTNNSASTSASSSSSSSSSATFTPPVQLRLARRISPPTSLPTAPISLPQQPQKRTTSTYVDSGMQTEAPPTPIPDSGDEEPELETPRPHHHHHHQRRGHTRNWSSVSSSSSISSSSTASSILSAFPSESSTRKSSFVNIDVAKPPNLFWPEPQYFPNPVIMGRMTDYFRSSGYCLGDALG